MDEQALQRDPTYLAFQAGLTTICSLPASKGDAETVDTLKKLWWGNYRDSGWITPQIWAGAAQEIQEKDQWRPAWRDVYATCEYVKLLLDEEGVKNYFLAQQQRAERARTGVENREGRDEPRLPAPPEPQTAKEVRRATVIRHIAIARARMRRRNHLIETYCRDNGLAIGHCAIPEEAWKGLDEPSPEEIAAIMRETPPERTVGALYRALRPGQRQAVRVEWVKPDGTTLADESGDAIKPYYVEVGPPDPPSPSMVKERERVMAKEPVVAPYNDSDFRRDERKTARNPYP